MGTIEVTRKEFEEGVEVKLDERTTIVVGPDAALVTLHGPLFEANKSFPRPRFLGELEDAFAFGASLRKPKAALVVAHALEGTPEAETLTQERAAIMAAWLDGDTQPWLNAYTSSVPEEKRWGAREDHFMLGKIPDMPEPDGVRRAVSPRQADSGDPRVRQYQELRGLGVDGIAGPITRGALVEDYFKLSRTTAPGASDAKASDSGDEEASAPEQPLNLDVGVSSHGAGANFPLENAREEDAADGGQSKTAASGTRGSNGSQGPDLLAAALSDERLDFFFFLADASPQPAPAGADGPEYTEWVDFASLTQRIQLGSKDGSVGTQLSVLLFDKTGRARHANRKYQLSGPETLIGTTDADGKLDHDDVLPGDYTLTLTLEFFEGDDQIVDTYTSPVVVVAGQDLPQIRMIGALPHCVLARLGGMLFDTNKAFLLPSAMSDLQDIRKLYETNNPSELLVVGHTDTTADASVNDSLSLERAEATLAYLEDDVDAWFNLYGNDVRESRRWGETEDAHMLGAILDIDGVVTQDEVDQFKADNGITEEGVGDETRKELIRRYMLLDGAEIDAGEFNIKSRVHGCGENFPVDDTAQNLDDDAQDGKKDALDRRVELFFFDTEFGIAPEPQGDNSPPGSTQYPTWRKQASLAIDSSTDAPKTAEFLLLDEDGNPMPGARCRIEKTLPVFIADERGVATVALPRSIDEAIPLEWAAADTPDDFQHAIEAFIEPGDDAARRLHNIGHGSSISLDSAAVSFQSDEGVDHEPEPVGLVSGKLPPASESRLKEIYDDAANV